MWQTHRQRLRQLLRTAGPLRRPSVHPGHASALILHRGLIVFSVVSTVLRSWFVLPQRADVAVVVKLDRPFSLQVRNTNSCKCHKDKNTVVLPPFRHSLYLSLIWIQFASHLHGSWSFTCMSPGCFHANLFASFSLTCLGFAGGESGSPFQPLLPRVCFAQDKHNQPQISYCQSVSEAHRDRKVLSLSSTDIISFALWLHGLSIHCFGSTTVKFCIGILGTPDFTSSNYMMLTLEIQWQLQTKFWFSSNP